ncbi:hypothetical protein H696_04789 [Fonticula alba]|uniref:Rubisco LSMT substrate-binding domain-containing protein n=1 Tax=Fonticula alba TaxID=691883 RepID=A0A058Z3N2_FONAL|nr:hypothetical protein H696_04789 [Fonticula alba]KCV68498.1 hypothetical protein H696_04789 [Fonticula alba]|eukprot:XP_009496930.1 hypothetical protein H696_04789 [Fonticula alba]
MRPTLERRHARLVETLLQDPETYLHPELRIAADAHGGMGLFMNLPLPPGGAAGTDDAAIPLCFIPGKFVLTDQRLTGVRPVRRALASLDALLEGTDAPLVDRLVALYPGCVDALQDIDPDRLRPGTPLRTRLGILLCLLLARAHARREGLLPTAAAPALAFEDTFAGLPGFWPDAGAGAAQPTEEAHLIEYLPVLMAAWPTTPPSLNACLYGPAGELASRLLRGTGLGPAVLTKRMHLLGLELPVLRVLVCLLALDGPGCPAGPLAGEELLAPGDLLWADGAFRSRVFRGPFLAGSPGTGPSEAIVDALVPVVDYCNHRVAATGRVTAAAAEGAASAPVAEGVASAAVAEGAASTPVAEGAASAPVPSRQPADHLFAQWQASFDGVTIYSADPVLTAAAGPAGQERALVPLLTSYGDKGSDELIFQYGFFPEAEANPHDRLVLSVAGPQALAQSMAFQDSLAADDAACGGVGIRGDEFPAHREGLMQALGLPPRLTLERAASGRGFSLNPTSRMALNIQTLRVAEFFHLQEALQAAICEECGALACECPADDAPVRHGRQHLRRLLADPVSPRHGDDAAAFLVELLQRQRSLINLADLDADHREAAHPEAVEAHQQALHSLAAFARSQAAMLDQAIEAGHGIYFGV